MNTKPITIGQDGVRAANVRRGRVLEYLTIGWNCLEAVAALIAGLRAGSIALVGFGFDSLIEVASSFALLWRLHLDAPEQRERAEARALKIVGVCFILLGGYICIDSVRSLFGHRPPDKSYLGIAVTAAAVVVMPLLSRAKRRVAANINSRAMHADSRQSDLCAYLSAITLVGLGLNALFGWWWADPVAALIMIPIIVKAGIEALRGETCCDEGNCR
jgi:divalent metal cation (Fe/Co/Zn/Cd) transporter